MQLFVGTSTLKGKLSHYAERFNLLELSLDANNLPRPSKLARWLEEVPEQFAFSLRLPQKLGNLELADEPLERTQAVCQALSARWLVLRTEASVQPSARSKRRLQALVERLKQLTEAELAWEPRGVWQPEELSSWGEELSVFVVRDVGRPDPSPVAWQPPPAGQPILYTRLRALGEARRIRSSAIETLADTLADYEQGYVILEGEGAVSAARKLRELVGDG